MTWRLEHSYARLPGILFHKQTPATPLAPALLKVNAKICARLGLDPNDITAEIATGASLPQGADPLAQAYAGHQFGQFVPQLGDGRALLLGEQIAPDGVRFDIQLKGAGRTPFSRGGDGQAWLGPVLREYLMSEAMAALGIPTTRALAMATTGADVYRPAPLRGAVLMRVASSHIRVGTFQFAVIRKDRAALAALTEHTLARHYPDATGPAELLEQVSAAQARLIAGWMSMGFIHGVMNTDNCAVSGETIDYGPCAFMEGYDPARVFSSIDHRGRYAYGNQPQIALWNLVQFASCLAPLMPDETAAIEAFTPIINSFTEIYQAEWLHRFRGKLGLPGTDPGDQALIEDLLTLMAQKNADFTNTFARLSDPATLPDADWHSRWQARIGSHDPAPDMAHHNPTMVPRLHQIEAAISAALDHDLSPFDKLLDAATTPFAPRALGDPLTEPAPHGQEVTTTYCGT